MAKNREAVTCNGRAAFYAAMWEDIRQCAMDNGWAVALHGSLSADMDIMAMPWVTNAVSFAELVKAIRLLFKDNHMPGVEIAYNQKPHGRIVATIPIWADFYLDISTIDPESLRPKGEWIITKRHTVSPNPYMDDNYHAHAICSKCGFCIHSENASFGYPELNTTNFCPNCGADMRGDT